MPVSYAVSAGLPAPAVHVIHENPDWTAPLFAALESRGIPYRDWNLGSGELAAFETAPQGVFYNRMSASSHTRGNRYAPEMTAGVLAWLEAQGRRTLNGRAALNLEISKLVQYAALRRAGLAVPDTVAATTADGVTEAFSRFDGKPVITKHNRAGKGLGVQLFRGRKALSDYVNGADFEPSVDGITLVQRYIAAPDQTITRVEFIGRKLAYAVRVDTSNGFELCPADVCALDNVCMADSNQADIRPIRRFAEAIGTRILGVLPRDPLVCEAEMYRQCIVQYAPESPVAVGIQSVIEAVVALDRTALEAPKALLESDLRQIMRGITAEEPLPSPPPIETRVSKITEWSQVG